MSSPETYQLRSAYIRAPSKPPAAVFFIRSTGTAKKFQCESVHATPQTEVRTTGAMRAFFVVPLVFAALFSPPGRADEGRKDCKNFYHRCMGVNEMRGNVCVEYAYSQFDECVPVMTYTQITEQCQESYANSFYHYRTWRKCVIPS